MQRTYSEFGSKKSDTVLNLIRKNFIRRQSSIIGKSPETTMSLYPQNLLHRANSLIESQSKYSKRLINEYKRIEEKEKIIRQTDAQMAYFRKISDQIKKGNKKIFMERKLILLLKIIYVIIGSILNLTSVIIYALFTSSNEVTDYKKNLFFINFSLAHLFFLEEIIQSFLLGEYKIYFLRFHIIIDIILIVCPYISLFEANFRLMVDFIRILNILKLFKLFPLLKNWRLMKNESYQYEEKYRYKSRYIVKRKIIKLSIYLFSIVIILAGIVQQISAFHPDSFNIDYMTFSEGFYYMVITLLTVGYGDIFPTLPATRFLIVFIIFTFAYILSDKISQLVSLLQRTKNIQEAFDFEDHYIIFGDIPNDNVTQIHLISFFEEIYAEYRTLDDLEKSPQCILITLQLEEENKKLSKLEQFHIFNNRIFHLNVKSLDSEVFRLANFAQCRAIYCLNGNINSDYLISDKLITFYVRNLKNIIEDEECLNNQFNPHHHHPFHSTINTKSKRLFIQYMYYEDHFPDLIRKNIFTQSTIPRMKLKYSMFAKNIFVKGWITFITNLFVKSHLINNFYEIPVTQNYYFNHYLSGMNQSLINFKFPKILINLDFKKCVEILYNLSIEYVNKVKLEKVVYEHKYRENEKLNMSHILLIGVMKMEKLSNFIEADEISNYLNTEKNNIESNPNLHKEIDKMAEAEQLSILIKKIEFNPIDHKIGEDDLGIFICSHFFNFEDFYKFIDEKLNDDEFINKYINNVNLNDININNSQLNLEKKLCHHFSTKSQLNNKFIDHKYKKFLFIDRSNRYKHFGLLEMEYLKDHILILGWNPYMELFVTKIRMHSILNTIVIVSNEVEKNEIILKKFRNLYLIKGDYLDLNLLRNLNTHKAHHVVIITSRSDVDPNKEDSNSVLAARIIEQYFNVPFTIEIREIENVKFLGNVPVFNKTLEDIECMYPNFAEGNVLFNRFFDKMNARAMTNNFEVACIKELIQLDFTDNIKKLKLKEKSINTNLYMEKEKALENIKLNFETKIFTNSLIKIFSFSLDDYYDNKTYKDLCLDLIKLNMIPLAIYNKKCYHHHNINEESFVINLIDKNGNSDKEIIIEDKMKKYCRILQDELNQSVLDYCHFDQINSSFLITNPSYDMILNSEMDVIILGRYRKLVELTSPVKCVNLAQTKNKRLHHINHINNKNNKISLNKRINRLNVIRKKVDRVEMIMKKLKDKLRKIKFNNEKLEIDDV